MRILRIISASVVIILLLFLGLSQVHSVKMYVFNRIAENIESETGWRLSVQEIDLMLPFEVKLRNLKIENAEMALAAKNAILRFDAGSFFKRRLSFHSISFDEVAVEDNGAGMEQNEGPAGEDAPVTEVPLSLEVRRLIVRHLQLPGAPLVNINGSIMADKSDEKAFFEAEIEPADKEAPAVSLRITGEWQKGEAQVEVCLNKEKEKGDLFDKFHILASGRLKGPLLSWNALFGPPEMEAPPLSGRFEAKFSLPKSKSEGELHGRLVFNPQTRRLMLQDLDGALDSTEIKGAVSVDKNLNLAGTAVKIKVEDLSDAIPYIEKEVSGSSEIDISLDGSLKNPILHAKLHAPLLTIEGYPLNEFSAAIDAKIEQEAIHGTFNASIMEDDQILHSKGELRWNWQESIQVTDFILNLPELEMRGNLDALLPSGPFTGFVTGKLNDLRFLGRLFDKKSGGAAEFSATLSSGEDDGQNIDLSLSASSFKWDGHRAEELEINTAISDIYKSPKGNFSFKAQNGIFSGIVFSTLEIMTGMEKDKELWPFNFHLDAENRELYGEGGWLFKESAVIFALESLRGSLDKYPFRLVEPARFAASDEKVELSPLLFTIGEGSLYASFEYKEEELHTSLRLVEFPLKLLPLKGYAPPVSGYASGDAYLHGTREKVLGHLNLAVSSLEIDEHLFKQMPPLEGNVNIQLKEELLQISGRLEGVGDAPIELDASLPARAMLAPPFFKIEHDRPIALKAAAEGPMAPVLELFFPDTLNLKGHSRLNLSVTGTLEKPLVDGEVHISQGSVESYTLGTSLTGLEATLKGDGSTIELTRLTASDVGSGTVSGTGKISLSAEEGYPYEFNLNFNNTRLINLDNVASTVGGGIILKGNRKTASIEGTVTNVETVISMPQKSPEAAYTVDITYINQDPSRPPPTSARYRPALAFPVALNLQLNIPGNLRISDTDLASEWQGELKVEGTTEEPEFQGNLKSVGGNYMLNGRQFNLTEGQITFAGPIEKKTTVYAVVSREINDIVVEIVLKGKVKNPDILLRSKPALSQQEILSLILFGRVPSEISSGQGEILEQSLENLTEETARPGALNKIQNTFGIDTFEVGRGAVDSDNPDEITVQIGKYLTPNLFISINRSFADEGVNKIAIESRLRRHLKLQLEAGSNSEGQVSLKWRHDY